MPAFISFSQNVSYRFQNKFHLIVNFQFILSSASDLILTSQKFGC